MSTTEMHERHVEITKGYKEAHVAEDPEDRDVAAALTFYRGDSQVLIVTTRGDRDVLIGCIKLFVPGLLADSFTMVMETFHSNTPINPLTGASWHQGEMQAAWQATNGKCEGLEEAVMVFPSDHAGHQLSTSLPYIYVENNGVEWLDPFFTDNQSEDDSNVGGALVDEFSQVWADRNEVWTARYEHLFENDKLSGVPEEAIRMMCDIVVVKAAEHLGMPIQVAFPMDHEHAEQLQQMVKEIGLDSDVINPARPS